MVVGVALRTKPISVSDPATQRALEDIRRNAAEPGVFAGARVLKDVQLVSGTTLKLSHGLGRRLSGWIIVSIDRGAALSFIHDEQREHSELTDRFLFLRAEGISPKVNVLVF